MENYSEILQELISSHSVMVCDMPLKFHFLHSHLGFFLKTRQPSPMNMAKVSIKIFFKLKGGTVKNVVHICWLTAAVVLQGKYGMAKERYCSL